MVVAATGFFDGVHLGHRAVITALLNEAKITGKQTAIISFWPHPRAVLQQDAFALKLLTTLEEKKEIILSLGVDYFHVLPFTKDLSKFDSRRFMKEYLIDKFNISSLIIGYDHRFGASTQDQNSLSIDACSLGIDTVWVNEILMDTTIVSSTKIRSALEAGDITQATQMLGYNYSLQGVVVVGNKIGRTIGFPTANMQLYEPLKLVPSNGVYAVKVAVLDREYLGVCNIGNRPTVGKDNARTIETHILEFDEDIYGLDLKIEFLKYIRAERKFDSMDALKTQILKDKEFAIGYSL